MEDDDEVRKLGLELSIGVGDEYMSKRDLQKNKRAANYCLDLSLPLDSKEEAMNSEYSKREGSISSSEAYNDKDCNDIRNKKCSSKKLRLTAEQTTILEDSFKLRNTLNKFYVVDHYNTITSQLSDYRMNSRDPHSLNIMQTQKEALANRLNLRPRQVEVWFQNRRARTKLKQTEVDCGFLKKCCENLSDENQRLKKELQELPISLKLQQPPLHIHLPKATTLAMCPWCEKFVQFGSNKDDEDAKKMAAAIANQYSGPI